MEQKTGTESMLVLPNAMAVQEEGCKEKLAWWEMGLDS